MKTDNPFDTPASLIPHLAQSSLNNAKHTALPWQLDPPDKPIDGRHGWFIRPAASTGLTLPGARLGPAIAEIPHKCYDWETTRANAEYIVRAVNCHDELIACLEADLHDLQEIRLCVDSVACEQRACNLIDGRINGIKSALLKARGGAS